MKNIAIVIVMSLAVGLPGHAQQPAVPAPVTAATAMPAKTPPPPARQLSDKDALQITTSYANQMAAQVQLLTSQQETNYQTSAFAHGADVQDVMKRNGCATIDNDDNGNLMCHPVPPAAAASPAKK